eukprot:gnl/Spiro4/5107_TR2554_c0_g2_i1.p1 gnl/Spiro4/5107_TR2554_c0_g2~~gnl/Spiro4/5107_TR2554_c0_g2_i1.p1  ORF type:complete len:309 (+),score=12.89 gnl/Spiro4/5107_TR2554_c0_g2_i1:52-927(+)
MAAPTCCPVSQLEYTEPLAPELTCAICHAALLDPVGCKKCQHFFCRACVRARVTSCPTCRDTAHWSDWRGPDFLQPHRPFCLLLDALKVRCPNHTRHGCPAIVPRGDLDAHVRACVVPCEAGCGERVAPNDRVNHQAICPRFVLPCPAADVQCSFSCPREHMAEHERACELLRQRPLLLRIQALERQNARFESNWFPVQIDRSNTISLEHNLGRVPTIITILFCYDNPTDCPAHRPIINMSAMGYVNNHTAHSVEAGALYCASMQVSTTHLHIRGLGWCKRDPGFYKITAQ